MVFKSFTHLARPSFSKAINHGYAQSVVAATQSSYASSTAPYPRSNKVPRPQTAQLHTAFQNASGQSNVSSRTGLGTTETSERKHGDPNLLGYYEALWKRQQLGEDAKEWTQFQFAKRIEWKPPSVIPSGRSREVADLGSNKDVLHGRGSMERSYSANAVDDIKKADAAAEATALAKVDEAIAQVILDLTDSSAPEDSTHQSLHLADQGCVSPSTSSGIEISRSPLLVSPARTATPASNVTINTTTQDAESQALSRYISKLHEQQSYRQIPRVFESLVLQGLKPTINDYNALLASAIHLPITKHQVVPKALDIYSDMLRRKVEPDTLFYSSILELLASRALDVSQMKQVLDEKRLRFGGIGGQRSFMLTSNETEYDILLQDCALSNAMKIFQKHLSSKEPRQFPPDVYRLLVTACAVHGNVEDMILVYTQMESFSIPVTSSMFPPMIKAFASSGDLSSAVECYNEYKALAIADDAGRRAVIDRDDNGIYAAIVKAYAACGKHDGAMRFINKVMESYTEINEQGKERIEAVQDSVMLDGLIQDRLDAKDLLGALRIAEESSLTPPAQRQAMARICIEGADHGDYGIANKAFRCLPHNGGEKSLAAIAMLALHIRDGNLEAARATWSYCRTFDHTFVEPATSYAVALIGHDQVEEALPQVREVFGQIRTGIREANLEAELAEEIDEAIELISATLSKMGAVPSSKASMSLLWAMVENGGLVTSVAEEILARLGPEDISNLGWQDVILALQVEAGLIGDGVTARNISHSARFAHLLEIAVDSHNHVDERTTALIEKALGVVSLERADLITKWHSFQQNSMDSASLKSSITPQATPVIPSPEFLIDSYDPYASTTDYRGSSVIVDELENHRNNAGLNEALIRFRNIRRAGRHPRYIVYGKLIAAAAKESRTNLLHDIMGMARTDIPFLPQYSVVRHGWSIILDTMVGACLSLGRRTLAEQFHQEMLDKGSAPTANTFGLYITTLKDTTETFDEASEAVSIFNRALSEGVAPSSFLYNALIGKLGKARRIDDCLRYFQEMRAAGIRPTSVTYGTVVNALCRVSDDRFAEELFDEMESMPNYKARPAPYNSLMQFFLTTKRDSQKVLAYYNRMQSREIQPTMHTFKLLIDTYATLEPVNLAAAEDVLQTICKSGKRPEAVHYASLIHAKGCALHDMEGARQTFDQVLASGEVLPHACLYQALFESMVANHCVAQTETVLERMSRDRVEMTPYIANTLIHGWALENNLSKSKDIYEHIGKRKREPSTYEAMTRAFLTAQDRDSALSTVHEMLSRGYPAAVSSKILDLVGHGSSRMSSFLLPNVTV
ncbi:hypothetical protein ACLMJK_003355 [Lecanora helva]